MGKCWRRAAVMNKSLKFLRITEWAR
ncbi:MAG: VF530 family DNA-binding protein [Deltaproteobacteria bacterium]|nr:VF530 family DNA-binding protein [Deltaproteobacteria bacterium]